MKNIPLVLMKALIRLKCNYLYDKGFQAEVWRTNNNNNNFFFIYSVFACLQMNNITSSN